MKTKFYHIFFFLLVFLFSYQLVNAQKSSCSIKGKILTNDGQPAISVTIELQRLKRATFSEKDGFFILHHLPALRDTLIISSAETKIYKQVINLNKDHAIDLGVIQLRNNMPQLPGIEMMGRKANSYKSDYSFFGNKTETTLKDIPQSISTVTKELIHDKMEFTLKDAMDEVAGINQYSGFDEYTIRGFRAENSRDINGLRGYNTIYTSSMLVNIERVEVIKGPTATLYGNCDPVGTINLVTKNH